jgi:hypothetical protein
LHWSKAWRLPIYDARAPLTSQCHGVGLCSEQAARDAILYSYRHGFSGFAATLTDSQAARLAGELLKLHLSLALWLDLPLPCVFDTVMLTKPLLLPALLCVLAQF